MLTVLCLCGANSAVFGDVSGSDDIIVHLLSRGADAQVQVNGNTALMLAVEHVSCWCCPHAGGETSEMWVTGEWQRCTHIILEAMLKLFSYHFRRTE